MTVAVGAVGAAFNAGMAAGAVFSAVALWEERIIIN
jgi:hypothetical protein